MSDATLQHIIYSFILTAIAVILIWIWPRK
jgi:hypothetical protein